MEDYSQAELEAAVASGKTTLIYSGGSSMAVANHVEVARYVARRVAEELGNALVLPVTPDAQAPRRRSAALRPRRLRHRERRASRGWLQGRRDHRRRRRRARATARSRILRNGSSADWSPSGVRVHPSPPTSCGRGRTMTFNARLSAAVGGSNHSRRAPQGVEDEAELLFVDPERKWLRTRRDRRSRIARVVVPALGKSLSRTAGQLRS